MTTSPVLKREIGLFGAVMMGLGSIVGTGVFVSIATAAGIAGPAVILATALAAVVATCNALSSAQLAASHPVSGGTYEYGYKYLTPSLGFTAGWMFLFAKSASAATAALGFAGYLLHTIGRGDNYWLLILIALLIVIALTMIVLLGMRQSNRTNIVIVSITLASLALFILAGISEAQTDHFKPIFNDSLPNLLHATALMFVAYTGYGRIATLGEEVHEPRMTIPRAIIVTLVVSMLLYVAVAAVGIGAVGANSMGDLTGRKTAPLQEIARTFGQPGVSAVVAVGAMTAMLGVLLNLILGLSRVVLAMGRRGDMPRMFQNLNAERTTPTAAVILVSVVVAGLVLIGNVKTTWSFSAFTVLIYYAITNLAAIRLSSEQRLYPIGLAWAGLIACLFLAFWVEVRVWMVGLGILLIGLIGHALARRVSP